MTPDIGSSDPATHFDNQLIDLWERASVLKNRYRNRSRRHKDLLNLRRRYGPVRDSAHRLGGKNWHRVFAEMGQEKGLCKLCAIYRRKAGKKKKRTSILAELSLQQPMSSEEEQIIRTFFPHAAARPPDNLLSFTVSTLDPDLNQPFVLGEMLVALAKRKSRPVPGHDGVTWQMLTNLRDVAKAQLLEILNRSLEPGDVPEHLRLTLVNPEPGIVSDGFTEFNVPKRHRL